MLDLRDPIWQGIGALVSFSGILVPFFIWFFYQRTYKSLSYDYRSTPLFNEDAKGHQRLRTLFDEKEVKEPTLVVVEIRNSGNVAILSEDFEAPRRGAPEKPLVITINNVAVLEANIDTSSPIHLKPQISHQSSGKVQVAPLLLNKGDEFSIRVVVDGANPEVSVQSRIAGIKEVKLQGKNRLFSRSEKAGIALTSFGLLLYFINVLFVNILQVLNPIFGLILGLASMGFMIGGFRLFLHDTFQTFGRTIRKLLD